MTNEQVLRKAIEKAFGDCTEEYAKSQIERDEGYRVIFCHKFAEAFATYLIKERQWKLPDRFSILIYQGTCNMLIEDVKNWFLQQMVLEKEPLKYLEKFLEG